MDTLQENSKNMSSDEQIKLLQALKTRFEKNKVRHMEIDWVEVESRLKSKPEKLHSLSQMENSGGEPDVVGKDQKTGEILFFDCSAETPEGRRNLCYDREALDKRKEHKPANSAMDMAESMGITLLTEEQYRYLQTLGKFDTKTSSWMITPPEIRKLGGAIFGDRRYNTVFTYHNGADSYYGARGFRGILRV